MPAGGRTGGCPGSGGSARLAARPAQRRRLLPVAAAAGSSSRSRRARSAWWISSVSWSRWRLARSRMVSIACTPKMLLSRPVRWPPVAVSSRSNLPCGSRTALLKLSKLQLQEGLDLAVDRSGVVDLLAGVQVLQQVAGGGGVGVEDAADPPALTVVGEGEVDGHLGGAFGHQRLVPAVGPGAVAVQGEGDRFEDGGLAGAGVPEDGDERSCR